MSSMRFHRRREGAATIIIAAALLAPLTASAQAPAAAVGVGFGVDTTISVVRDIVALTRAYLAHPDSSARARGLWSTATPFDARVGDVATAAYQGFNATILAVTPADPGDSVYTIKVLHASSSTSGKPVAALALERFFAVSAPGSPFGWQLSGALPRLTRAWMRCDAGRITFWYAPGITPSPAKARNAARFVDSVGVLFGVAPPEHIDAYVASSMDEARRAIGLDFFPDGSGPDTGFGGVSLTGTNILLIGDPRLGEAFLHEFVHVVLAKSLHGGTAAFNEGVAVWLGGHQGRPARSLYPALQRYQVAHPAVTLAQVVSGDAPGGAEATTATYATAALIVQAIYRRSGVAGLRRFAGVTGSTDAMLARLPDFVGPVGEAGIDGWWRAEAVAASNHPR